MKIHLAGFFAVDAERFGGRNLDQASETGRILAGIKMVDEGNAALPLSRACQLDSAVLPTGKASQAGHHDSAF